MHSSALLRSVPLLALGLAAASASAVPINGMISVAGFGSYSGTSVSFVPGSSSVSAFGETGAFTAIGTTSNVTLNGFTYSPSLPAPVTLFSATNAAGTATAAFTLTSITQSTFGNNQLSINGRGTLTLTGYEPTVGDVFFSTQGPTGGSIVSFSLTSIAPVPEPAPIAALGVGALALLRRRKRS